MLNVSDLCYCSSGKEAQHCCLPIINGKRKATSAEELMRSRYSAYFIADINYLMKSHHPKNRPINDKKEILRWAKSVQWMGLEIIKTKDGLDMDNEGWVEFRAVFIENSLPQQIHEYSYFVKENGTWYYLSGEHK